MKLCNDYNIFATISLAISFSTASLEESLCTTFRFIRARLHYCVSCVLLQVYDLEHRVTSAYHPQTNGLTEQMNQTLKGSLIQVVNNRQDQHLDKILFSYRYVFIGELLLGIQFCHRHFYLSLLDICPAFYRIFTFLLNVLSQS